MRITHIKGTQALTWYFKAVIAINDKHAESLPDTIFRIGAQLQSEYDDELHLVNSKHNTIVTEDELTDLQHPRHYCTNILTNHSSSTTTILFQLRTYEVDKYYNNRDPLRGIQFRFPNWIQFRFDEFLGVPTTLLDTIMNVPHKQIHQDLLARAISANLPPHAANIKPIVKPVPIEFSYTSDGRRTTTTVIGIYGLTSIAAEVSGTVRGLLQHEIGTLQCGTGSGQYYSLSDLRGPNRKAAIDLHQNKIANQTMVNLYQLKVNNLDDDISPDVCSTLLIHSHKSCQLINSKKDLLQAYILHEHQATSARLSYFTDRNNNPVLQIHTTKQHVHRIYEALYALDSSPHRVHFFYFSIYHALPWVASVHVMSIEMTREVIGSVTYVPVTHQTNFNGNRYTEQRLCENRGHGPMF